jgi:RNase P protein component
LKQTPAGDWLALKRVPVPAAGAPASGKPAVYISVPKRSVRLATKRNRIKRLLREAVRRDGRFTVPGHTYHFRVARPPREDGLEAVSRSVGRLADTIFKE